VSDASVAAALRSQARLVVVEAPAGCGKTFQGSDYARDAAANMRSGRVLVLAHTHAACDVFAVGAQNCPRIEIRTIDSLIAQVASAYHSGLGLPTDASAWARRKGTDGYKELAYKVAKLVQYSPMVARVIAQRYPIVICDEHQDCSAEQHALAMSLLRGGASVRLFGDPMQRIYGAGKNEFAAGAQRWSELTQKADAFEYLDAPHRWSGNAYALGQWILAARETLRAGGPIDLRGTLPTGLSAIVA
jgi:hypothetical protein